MLPASIGPAAPEESSFGRSLFASNSTLHPLLRQFAVQRLGKGLANSMNRSRSVSETSVGLFAFLDVLMSTMGSLILVLMVVTPKIRQEAVARAAAAVRHAAEARHVIECRSR